MRCSVLGEVAGHKSSTVKEDRVMNSKESSFIADTVGKLYSIGIRK